MNFIDSDLEKLIKPFNYKLFICVLPCKGLKLLTHACCKQEFHLLFP